MMLFFFFKQKTAYEMRISDWSSDVCSSDLVAIARRSVETHGPALEWLDAAKLQRSCADDAGFAFIVDGRWRAPAAGTAQHAAIGEREVGLQQAIVPGLRLEIGRAHV